MRARLFALLFVPLASLPVRADCCCGEALVKRLFAALCGPWCGIPEDEHARIVQQAIAEAKTLAATPREAKLPFSGDMPLYTGGTRLDGDGVFDPEQAIAEMLGGPLENSKLRGWQYYREPEPVVVIPMRLQLDILETLFKRVIEDRDLADGSRILLACRWPMMESASEKPPVTMASMWLVWFTREILAEKRPVLPALWLDYAMPKTTVLLMREDAGGFDLDPSLAVPCLVASQIDPECISTRHFAARCSRVEATDEEQIVKLCGRVVIEYRLLGIPIVMQCEETRVNLQTGDVQILVHADYFELRRPFYCW